MDFEVSRGTAIGLLVLAVVVLGAIGMGIDRLILFVIHHMHWN